MTFPAVPEGPGSLWSKFPVDPRSAGDLRAGDADRETARGALAEAYADGQLTHDEYDDRMASALDARHLGQLVPLLNDLSPRSNAPGPPNPKRKNDPARQPHWSRSPAARTALFVVGVTNAVWAITSMTSGTLIYYWPIWPTLGMAIMMLAVIMSGQLRGNRPDRS